jgi:hypothetical protein
MENTCRISEKFTSTLKETKGGVPRGSVLSPVLFLLYINDLPINIQGGRTTLFADDTNIKIEATNANILKKKIKEVMEQLSNWFHLNKLIINTDKTTAIAFHSWQNKNNLKPKIVFQDMDIKYKNDTKYLGLYLTEDVKWDVHIKHVSDILNKSYYVIQSLKTVISISTLRRIYFANFHSHLRYGILFWGGDPQSIKIFKLQKKVVRVTCNVKRKTSCRELFRTLNILPVPCVYIMETVYYIRLNNEGLKQNLAKNDYKTRNRSDFQTQFCRTNIFKKSLNNLGTKLYNKLPNYLKNLENSKLFKNNLKLFYYNRPFIQLMNIYPTCRHLERELYRRIWYK